MPEIADSSSLPNISENPYPASLDVLMRMSTVQMKEAALRGKANTLAALSQEGKAHLVPRAEEIFNVVYNVFLLGTSHTENFVWAAATDQEKKDTVLAAQIVHKLVHNIWCAKTGISSPEQIKGLEKIVSTTEALISKNENDAPIVSSRRHWSAMKAELAAVETFTKEGWSVILPDHQQPFNPKKDWAHEILQMDLKSGVDFIVKAPSSRGHIGILVDTKARVHMRDKVSVSRKDRGENWRELNPVLKRILSENGMYGFIRAEIGIGSDTYNFYRPGESITKFAELKPEPRSDIVMGVGQLMRSYTGA